MRCYTQLTQKQRYQIHAFKKAGFNQTQIAREVCVHKSTICRELRRNRGLNGYRPLQAHVFAISRRKARSNNRITTDDWKLISLLIQLDLLFVNTKTPLDNIIGSRPRKGYPWTSRGTEMSLIIAKYMILVFSTGSAYFLSDHMTIAVCLNDTCYKTISLQALWLKNTLTNGFKKTPYWLWKMYSPSLAAFRTLFISEKCTTIPLLAALKIYTLQNF